MSDCVNNDGNPHLPGWEHYHITARSISARSIGAADALQVPLICFAALENHFCGHEQECAGVYRGTFSADNPLKFSEEVSFCGLHDGIVELRVEANKITGEYYRRSGFRHSLWQWFVADHFLSAESKGTTLPKLKIRDRRIEDYAKFHSNLSRTGVVFRETWQFGFRN